MKTELKLFRIVPATGFTVLVLAYSLLVAPFASADATVYRCGPKGSQWYSQIPCAENSEPVIIKEQHMLGGVGEVPVTAVSTVDGSGASEGPAADATSNAEAFITQLEKQRSEQLAEIDRDIARLETRAAGDAESGESAAEDDENAAVLASLHNTRDSIVSEYDAMISAARQRIDNP